MSIMPRKITRAQYNEMWGDEISKQTEKLAREVAEKERVRKAAVERKEAFEAAAIAATSPLSILLTSSFLSSV